MTAPFEFVKNLRERSMADEGGTVRDPLSRDAASLIQSQDEEIRRLREALAAILRCYDLRQDVIRFLDDEMVSNARSALNQKE